MNVLILRVDGVLPYLRLCSMHNPEKKDKTISAIAAGAILGISASMFRTRRLILGGLAGDRNPTLAPVVDGQSLSRRCSQQNCDSLRNFRR